MPDTLSRYTLAEMEDGVRRICFGAFYPVDPTSGQETSSGTTYDMLISKTDIDRGLNTALTLEMLKINQFAEEAFIVTVYLTAKATQSGSTFQPTQVALPADMLTLKEVSWLPLGVGFQNARPADWWPMPQISDQNAQRFTGSPAPPWHRDGNLMVFDQFLAQDNPSGIRVRYVRWVPFLVNPTDVIQSQLARPLQEVIMIEAAINLMRDKHQKVLPEQIQNLNDSQQVLLLAASNINKPESVRAYSPYMVRGTFSGRRSRRGRW